MHELSLTQSILEIALRHAKKADARKITHLHIVVGELSTMIDESVQFYWNIISKDTIAEGAALCFQRVPAEMQCAICQARFTIRQEGFVCPYCNSLEVRVLSGDQFLLDSIEIQSGESLCV
jgi:hydrogenase nickel incorporation protein HypA/HybF